MLGYVTLGTNDVARAAGFYDALLGLFDASRFMETERMVAWSNGAGASLGVIVPFDGAAACVGNGCMVALAATGPDQVKDVHAKALELGGRDEGAPGQRFGQFYGAYFRDLDGHKLAVFCILPEGETAA